VGDRKVKDHDMDMRYSPATGGFYATGLHADIPADAVGITGDDHRRLLAGQAAGHRIVAGADGRPTLTPPARPTTDARRAALAVLVKEQAAARILAVAPIWRQLNDARDLPLATGAARAAIEARYDAIDEIRAASDVLETRITIMSSHALARIDVAAPSHWPH
jgi:hypothetical protein